jgi:hypothetical protein
MADVPPAAADAFRASVDRLFAAALCQVKELAAAFADDAGPARRTAAVAACCGPHSLATRAALCASVPNVRFGAR